MVCVRCYDIVIHHLQVAPLGGIMVVESIVGTLLGGVLRLIPEWMGMKDKDAERRHELNLLKAEGELARQQANIALKQEDVKVDGKYLDALVAASQAQATKIGITWVDALR